MVWRRGDNIKLKVERGETSMEWCMMKMSCGRDTRGMANLEMRRRWIGIDRGVQGRSAVMIREIIGVEEEVIEEVEEIVMIIGIVIEIGTGEVEMIATDGHE